MIEIDYDNLERDLDAGTFRIELEEALKEGFREIHARGDRLPPPSYYASKISEIIHQGGPVPDHMSLPIWDQVLAACENAREDVTGESSHEGTV
ncbi:MAG: hypothetical protein KY459_15735 [Acidobacteria bacterium]|nr:hypothetical protein [Acidobacteriota bacterium]